MHTIQGEYKELTKWWKDQLGREVQGVKVSKRLHDTPLVVVTSKFGWSANMERIMKAQVCALAAWQLSVPSNTLRALAALQMTAVQILHLNAFASSSRLHALESGPGLQAMGDSEKSAFMRGQKTLEINPHHPLIQELKTLVRLGTINHVPLRHAVLQRKYGMFHHASSSDECCTR